MDTTLLQKAKLVRKWCMIATTEAASGHPTSCLSAADIMTVLFDKFYTYDLQNPRSLANDRLIFSKGHAAPLLYTLYALAGAFPIEELKTLRRIDSRLEGHPTPEFPYTEAATGSLGQGLSVGAGLAIAIQKEKQLEKKPQVYVLLGDGEMAEGQVWEAANFAGYYKLDNLIAIVDVNRLGQSQPTMFEHHVDAYANRLKSFGWEVVTIDGHDMGYIERALEQARTNTSGKPFAIVAQTEKGKGISFLQGKDNWHGKALPKADLEKALAELGPIADEVIFSLPTPALIPVPDNTVLGEVTIRNKPGEQLGTREVYGKTLVELGAKTDAIMSLDGDMKNSTYSQDFLKAYPDRFIECFIAEQNMVSVAAGLSRYGKLPFVSTFAAFLTRAFDQIRMAWLSKATIKFVGAHAGVSIGEDGASQMALEDIAMFGTLPGVPVLHPSDAVSMQKLLVELAKTEGIGYIRMLRPKTTVLYEATESFSIGGSKVLKQSVNDLVTVVGTGITVHEALKAYDLLQAEGIFIRVVDAYSISPIDKATLITSANETQKKVLITVEDHFIHGGMGDFALAAVSNEGISVEKIAVTSHAHSGKPEEVMDLVGISARHIIAKVKSLK